MNFLVKLPSNFRGTYPRTGKALVAASTIMLFLSGYSYYESFGAQKQVEWRKQQLKLPVYKLSEEQHINPPWNNQNIKQWLFRRVQVTGRVIHRSACLVPSVTNGSDGFEYVVPLLVRQGEDRSNPQGLIVSKGFIPYSMREPGLRYRIQNSHKQTFIGFVSQLQEYKNTHLIKGNSTDEGKYKFTSADIKDFARVAQFQNSKQASVAVVEELRQTGNLDQRNFVRRDLDCTATANYPYAKTQSGALQLEKMSWNYRNDSKSYLVSSIATFIIGASIF